MEIITTEVYMGSNYSSMPKLLTGVSVNHFIDSQKQPSTVCFHLLPSYWYCFWYPFIGLVYNVTCYKWIILQRVCWGGGLSRVAIFPMGTSVKQNITNFSFFNWSDDKCWLRSRFVALTDWGLVTHICVSKLTSIDSDNSLSPGPKPFFEPILGYCQLETQEQTSVTFESKFWYFHSRICIQKCLHTEYVWQNILGLNFTLTLSLAGLSPKIRKKTFFRCKITD